MTTYLNLQPDIAFDSSTFNQDIEDSNYTFNLRFNDRMEVWVMTIFNPDGEAIAAANLLNNIPLFRLYSRDDLFSGDVILSDDLNSKIACGRDDLNVKYTLLLSVP